MKINKLMFAMLAGAMLASCSDDLGKGDPNAGTEPTGTGFISVSVGLPSSVTSRANDQFYDGLDAEYAVQSCAVLFFQGREDAATFVKGYNITGEFKGVLPDGDQITSSVTATFPVDLTQTSESLWALAVVNYGSVMTVDSDGKVTMLEDGTVLSSTTTIDDFMAFTTTNDIAGNHGFLMLNTPYATAPGTADPDVADAPTGFVHLLAHVAKEKIYESYTQAANNPAAEIFVERATAKVTVIRPAVDITPDPMPNIAAEGGLTWIIDNTEPSSYVARNLTTKNGNYDATEAPDWMTYTTAITNPRPATGYRFVGGSPISTGMYRLYFGVDPRGAGIGVANGTGDPNIESPFKVLKDSDIQPNTFKAIGTDKPQYCYENTFDVDHMNWLNTTRVILKVVFEGGTFYTRGIDRTTQYSFDNAAAAFAHFVIENADVVKAYTAAFEQATTITINDLDYDDDALTAENKWLKVQYAINGTKLVVESFTLYNGEGEVVSMLAETDAEGNETKSVAAVTASAIENINTQATFNAYVDGVNYYSVRIKHFGDDLTPWEIPTNTDGTLKPTPNTNASYGTNKLTAAKNYLGRYGVLRNNWYELNISQIKKFGEPSVGDLKLDYTPDDNNDPEKAITCKINILSWAKRSQTEIL